MGRERGSEAVGGTGSENWTQSGLCSIHWSELSLEVLGKYWNFIWLLH